MRTRPQQLTPSAGLRTHPLLRHTRTRARTCTRTRTCPQQQLTREVHRGQGCDHLCDQVHNHGCTTAERRDRCEGLARTEAHMCDRRGQRDLTHLSCVRVSWVTGTSCHKHTRELPCSTILTHPVTHLAITPTHRTCFSLSTSHRMSRASPPPDSRWRPPRDQQSDVTLGGCRRPPLPPLPPPSTSSEPAALLACVRVCMCVCGGGGGRMGRGGHGCMVWMGTMAGTRDRQHAQQHASAPALTHSLTHTHTHTPGVPRQDLGQAARHKVPDADVAVISAGCVCVMCVCAE
jgi:hypothetical protein